VWLFCLCRIEFVDGAVIAGIRGGLGRMHLLDTDLPDRLRHPVLAPLAQRGERGVTEGVFWQRVGAAGLSLWELGELWGIHPHHLSPHFGPGGSVPTTVLIELALSG
jgi:hypothetical protein